MAEPRDLTAERLLRAIEAHGGPEAVLRHCRSLSERIAVLAALAHARARRERITANRHARRRRRTI